MQASIIKNNPNDKNVDGVHMPILLKESLELLDLKEGDIVVDCTLNRAGHGVEFAKKIGANGILIGIDLDNGALKEAKENIDKAFDGDKNLVEKNKPKIFFVNDNFENIEKILERLSLESGLDLRKVDAVYADLGISSQEIDVSGRGFSFMRDEPLLMTFKSEVGGDDLTAKEIVNHWSQDNIADILFNFADEKYSRRIAKNIAEQRKKSTINTTFELVDIIKSSVPIFYIKSRGHFAAKTFQALRMATNRELDSIINLIKSFKNILKESESGIERDGTRFGGRAGIITFHSTEDRIVKNTAKEENLNSINKKVIEATRQEEIDNPRSRSAKLRFYSKTKILNNKRDKPGYIK